MPAGRPCFIRTMIQSIIAPESKRIIVKLAASIPVFFRAMRQSSELPAKAIMVRDVRANIRAGDILETGSQSLRAS